MPQMYSARSNSGEQHECEHSNSSDVLGSPITRTVLVLGGLEGLHILVKNKGKCITMVQGY